MGGLLEKLLCWATNDYGKRRCRKAYWRVRAVLRRTMKSMNEQRLKFQYDAYSYALNFDDGSSVCSGGRYLDDTRLFAVWFLHSMYNANLQQYGCENSSSKEKTDGPKDRIYLVLSVDSS